jgi:hypothetical protein
MRRAEPARMLNGAPVLFPSSCHFGHVGADLPSMILNDAHPIADSLNK